MCSTTATTPPPPPHYCLRPLRYNYKSKINQPPASFAAESTLHHDLPPDLLGPERLINNEAFITHSGSVHDRKLYREERDWQPKHPKAPSNARVNYIRPDYHLKIQGTPSAFMKPFNPQPYSVSETNASFTPHYPVASMFGDAGIFITDHFVHLPLNRVNIVPTFTYDDMFSVMRKAHPYMTTYRLNHKNFEDEIPKHKVLDDLSGQRIGPSVSKNDSDCAIKYRVRPMLDPFEQNVANNTAPIRNFFRRPPYAGAPPRTHPPVPHMGMQTTYKDFFSRPVHPLQSLNHTSDVQIDYIQPPLSLLGLHRVPFNYDTEYTGMIGTGRNVSYFVENDVRDPLRKAQDKRDEAVMEKQTLIKRAEACGNSSSLLTDTTKGSGIGEGGIIRTLHGRCPYSCD